MLGFLTPSLTEINIFRPRIEKGRDKPASLK
jgi:hypothetical protein